MLFSVCAHTSINEAGDPNGFTDRLSLTPSLHREWASRSGAGFSV
jgi:hypothetical protein